MDNQDILDLFLNDVIYNKCKMNNSIEQSKAEKSKIEKPIDRIQEVNYENLKIKKTNYGYCILFSKAGINQNDITITLNDGILNIVGESVVEEVKYNIDKKLIDLKSIIKEITKIDYTVVNGIIVIYIYIKKFDSIKINKI